MKDRADHDWVTFLEWAVPRLGLRWRGFRNVRGQVEKRIARRMKTLGVPSLSAYRAYLEARPDEWRVLDDCCRVTISRFYRDRGVFDTLARAVLPGLAARALDGDGVVRCWSAGCASGEEPYTLAIVWRHRVQPDFPRARLRLLATDADETVLARARLGRYERGSLKELPPELLEAAFSPSENELVLAPELCASVEFRREDLRRAQPDETFGLILCRNLAFTYFDGALQEQMLARFAAHLQPDGYLVIGRHEALPGSASGWLPLHPGASIFRRSGAPG